MPPRKTIVNPILAKAVRSGRIDNIYRGIYAVVKDGRVVRSAGAIDQAFFVRSSEKPIQAASAVESGAADAFGLSDDEIAVMAGSHTAEDFHLAAVRSILKKAGLDESYLQCGAQPPVSETTFYRCIREGKPFLPIHNNCSGKHAGMLITAKHLGASLEDYLKPDHPVQRNIRRHMMRLAEFDEKKVGIGVDGCGVPTYAVPVKNMAILYANFSTPERFGGKLADACVRVIECVHKYPRMIAGPGRYCTELLEATGKKLFAKGGAEAIYTIGVVGKRTGIAIKMESGLEIGYKVFLVSLMRDMKIISAADVSRLPQYVRNPILNRKFETVGWVEAEKPRAAGKSPKKTSRRRA